MLHKLTKFCLAGAVSLIAVLIKKDFFSATQLESPNELPLGCSSFEVVHGTLGGAHTILLGESHLRKKETAQCIAALTIDDNIHEHTTLFKEGIAAGFDCSSAPLIQKCQGWDDMEAHGLSAKLNTKIVDTVYSPILTEEQIAEIVESTGTIINALQHKRNEALIQTLRDKPQNQRGIVIVGKAHLKKKCMYNVPDISAADYVRNELEKNKDANPYAILLMKDKEGEKQLPEFFLRRSKSHHCASEPGVSATAKRNSLART